MAIFVPWGGLGMLHCVIFNDVITRLYGTDDLCSVMVEVSDMQGSTLLVFSY